MTRSISTTWKSVSSNSHDHRAVPLAARPTVWRRLRGVVADVWSMAHFERPELSAYAESLMLDETRKGLTSMAVVSLVIQLAVLALNQRLNLQEGFVYTYALLALLSLHVVISAR